MNTAPDRNTLTLEHVQIVQRRINRVLDYAYRTAPPKTKMPHSHDRAEEKADYAAVMLAHELRGNQLGVQINDVWTAYYHARSYLRDAIREFRDTIRRTA